MPVINDIAFSGPSSPFLTQPGEAPYCNETSKPKSCASDETCACPHLVRVPYGELIDIIFVDDTNSKSIGRGTGEGKEHHRNFRFDI